VTPEARFRAYIQAFNQGDWDALRDFYAPDIRLVIGNGTYARVKPLPNPSNDARDIAAALKENGFSRVSVVLDADYRTMRNAITMPTNSQNARNAYMDQSVLNLIVVKPR